MRSKSKSAFLSFLQLEDRLVPSGVTGYRPIDEVGNNVANPTQGSANTDLVRVSPVSYSDGIRSPSLATDKNARVISDLLNNQADPKTGEDIDTVNGNSLTDFGYAFGQFIDHDMSLTPTDATNTFQIPADPNDPNDPNQMGAQTFDRSVTDPTTGTSASNPAQQVNVVTSYLDLSQVYGSTTAVADALRTHTDGLLKTSPGNMLPYDNSTYFTAAQLSLFNMANDSGMVATQNLFVTGDVRGNENVELTVIQTLFVRNHNRIAGELKQLHPAWTDEQLYQEARKLNIAQYQEIIYNNYLPDLLGRNAMGNYTGYNPTVNSSIATEFSTVAFRFGHSMLDNDIERHGNDGLDALPNDPAGADLSLAMDFFDPNVISATPSVDPFTGHTSTDIGAILKAQADGISQADDLMAVNDVRNLLFGNSGQTDNGMDLIARDVERARDDGIGSYNQVRVAYGLPPVTSFAQITSDVTVQKELQQAYGTVDKIDPFEGGMAEDHVSGSDLGALFTKILADQFGRLRAGDRYFYLNESFNPEEMKLLNETNTLAEVIEANTSITNLQADVFVFKATIGGIVANPANGAGVAGITVQLKDDSGSVIATTKTDRNGHYAFDQQSGITGTGIYSVAVVLPASLQLIRSPGSILISRGDTAVDQANFAVTPVTPAPVPPPVGGHPTPPAPPPVGVHPAPPPNQAPPPVTIQPPPPGKGPSMAFDMIPQSMMSPQQSLLTPAPQNMMGTTGAPKPK